MNIDFPKQQTLLYQVEDLEWNCNVVQCIKKCEEYISQFPKCRQVISSYAHMYQFIDYNKATDIAKKLFDEDKFYFKNTYIYVYLLKEFEQRGKDDIKKIYDTFKSYKGEDKDIYYYLAIAVAAKQLMLVEENKKYLQEAVKIFEGKDRMIARVYYHLFEATQESDYIQKSIKIQPNFDYSYIYLAHTIGDEIEKMFELLNKALSINPKNHSAIFTKSRAIYELRNKEDFYKIYEDFLKLEQYFPSKIFEYLNNIIYFEGELDPSERKYIPIDIIKKTYLFEKNNSHNRYIFMTYLQSPEFFSSVDKIISQKRELLQFYLLNDPMGYLYILNFEEDSEDEDGDECLDESEKVLFEESNLIMKTLFQIQAYNKKIKDQLKFKSQYSLWDLYVD